MRWGRFGESATNEANLGEDVITAQSHKISQVTANSSEVLGLDKLQTKPGGGRTEGGGRLNSIRARRRSNAKTDRRLQVRRRGRDAMGAFGGKCDERSQRMERVLTT